MIKKDFTLKKIKYPVCEPVVIGNERSYMLDAFDSNWIGSSGKYIDLLEEEFPIYFGKKYGSTCTNGTSALHLAMLALGISDGDEVIMPSLNGVYGAFATEYVRAIPKLVDVDVKTWNIDYINIEKSITDKTKAIMIVHLYGNPCEMDKIINICKKYNLYLIEDCAEAHGAEYNNQKCGSFGDVSIFSFYANKIITSGEGGILITNNKDIINKVKYLKNLCFPLTGERNFIHNDLGFNYRYTNLLASIAYAQFEKIELLINRRIRNNHLYKKYLSGLEGIYFPIDTDYGKNVYWMNCIIVDENKFGLSRYHLMKKLDNDGIQTRYLFNGMHRQPFLEKYNFFGSNNFKNSDFISDTGLYLPSSSKLSSKDIMYICDKICSYHNN